MKKRLISLLVITLLCSCLSGCEKTTPSITTTVYPIKYIIEQLVGDKVTVEYLNSETFIQKAVIREDYKEVLENTDLFLYIGELEPYMEIYESEIQSYDLNIINLASLSAIDRFKRYTTTKTEGITVVKEFDYYDDPAFSNVDVYYKDPFIWLDPIAMASMASTIKDWLQNAFPEDALAIENNFKTLQANLVRMDAEYQNLKNLSNVKFLSIACTFGNWQKAYGVQVYPAVLSKYGVLPNDDQLEVIKQTVKDEEIKYIVNDPTLPAEMMALYELLKTDLSLKEIKLSSLSVLSEEDIEKNKDYVTVMYENLTALEEAFK